MSGNLVTEELGEEDGSISSENLNSDLLITGEPTGGTAGIANGDNVSVNVEPVYQANEQPFVKDKPNGENVQEDGGKEEMFVDCAEEIEASGPQQILEGIDVVVNTDEHELNNGTHVQDLTDEMNHIRDELERAVAREANISQEYKEERSALKGELVHLHSRLKALNVQLYPPEIMEDDAVSLEYDFTLQEIINESSKLVEDALAVHSQSVSINRDLQTAIQAKEGTYW